ncbi:hypothetical protein [Calothrix sp. CCY 0018]|uniref:hypothetical protein n=1 Tax=Calothrix sp. CCY 0018 TaxID=3103864 RepID=UPI0039C5EA00
MLSSQKTVGFPVSSTLRGVSPKCFGFQRSETSGCISSSPVETSTTEETFSCDFSETSSGLSQAGS